MKRFLLFLLAAQLWAVGTCTVTGPTQLGTAAFPGTSGPYFGLVSVVCTADAANGTFPATPVAGLLQNTAWQGYYLARVEINPGSPNPTAGYALTVTDTNGVDQLAGQATQLPAAVPAAFGTAGSSSPVNGVHTINITGNAVNSAIVNILLYYGSASATSPPGKMVVEKGTRWFQLSQPAVSVLATASQPAKVGVRHVADCISYSAGNTTALAGAQMIQVNLRDGASGAGTVIWSQQFFIPTGPAQEIVPFTFCGLAISGTANTAMTLEFSGLVTNLFESVAISGYDSQ